jgi:hypoxanthine phosphoribosyltransferase
MRKVKILDKEFKISIPAATIKRAIEQVAWQINNDFDEDEILFISILNGSFMFASDLVRKVKPLNRISFIKLVSYNGTRSTGSCHELIGLSEDIKGRNVIILEDIIDSGTTIEVVVNKLKEMEPGSVKIATLLFKPQSYQKNLKIDYIGLEIPEDFIIGYGLDYNGYGRNLEDIYTLINK